MSPQRCLKADGRDQVSKRLERIRSVAHPKLHGRRDCSVSWRKQESRLTYPLQGVGNLHERTSTRNAFRQAPQACERHLRSVTAIFEAGIPCLDITQQLDAVEKAVRNAKRTLNQDHLDHCLKETVGALDLVVAISPVIRMSSIGAIALIAFALMGIEPAFRRTAPPYHHYNQPTLSVIAVRGLVRYIGG